MQAILRTPLFFETKNYLLQRKRELLKRKQAPLKRKHFSIVMFLQRSRWDNQAIYALQIFMFVVGSVSFAGCNSEMRQEEVDRYWCRRNGGDSCDTRIEELIHLSEDNIKALYLKHKADGTLYTPIK